jgi:hypothetical protein
MSKTLLYGATKIDETNSAYAPVESLAQFQWKNRVFVVFADRDNSRAARQENQLLADRSALDERDLVVLKTAPAFDRSLVRLTASTAKRSAAISRRPGRANSPPSFLARTAPSSSSSASRSPMVSSSPSSTACRCALPNR